MQGADVHEFHSEAHYWRSRAAPERDRETPADLQQRPKLQACLGKALERAHLKREARSDASSEGGRELHGQRRRLAFGRKNALHAGQERWCIISRQGMLLAGAWGLAAEEENVVRVPVVSGGRDLRGLSRHAPVVIQRVHLGRLAWAGRGGVTGVTAGRRAQCIRWVSVAVRGQRSGRPL